MARLMKRETPLQVSNGEAVDVYGPIDKLFGTWFGNFPTFHAMATGRRWLADTSIPVDEFERDGSLVVRAEIPGIDPDKDVELTVSGGFLHLAAHRREEERVEEHDYVRQEMRYGSFERNLPLPEGVSESDIKATYKDGILEIVLPMGKAAEKTKIPVTKS